jgi:group I intron endonuclease
MNMGIYKIESPSGGFYIGSSVNLKRRFMQHRHGLRTSTHVNPILQKVANKYGVDALSFSCIASVLNKEDIRVVEQTIMDDLKPEYNISKNAHSAVFDPEVTKKRIATLSKPVICLTDGVQFSSGYEAARIMDGESQRDQLPTALKKGWKWLGHFWKYAHESKTLEDVESDWLKRDKKRRENAEAGSVAARSRAVVCLNTGVTYSSCRAAELQTGTHKGSVSRSALFGSMTGGLLWKFADQDLTLEQAQEAYKKKKEVAEAKRIAAVVKTMEKRVRCIETGEIFESVRIAQKIKGLGKDAIRLSMVKKRKVHGYSWELVDA